MPLLLPLPYRPPSTLPPPNTSRSKDAYIQALNALANTGVRELPADFWDLHAKDMESWKKEGRTFYRVKRKSGIETNP